MNELQQTPQNPTASPHHELRPLLRQVRLTTDELSKSKRASLGGSLGSKFFFVFYTVFFKKNGFKVMFSFLVFPFCWFRFCWTLLDGFVLLVLFFEGSIGDCVFFCMMCCSLPFLLLFWGDLFYFRLSKDLMLLLQDLPFAICRSTNRLFTVKGCKAQSKNDQDVTLKAHCIIQTPQ